MSRKASAISDEVAAADMIRRIWAHDYTLWRPDPTEISNRLGWLTVPEAMASNVPSLRSFAADIRTAGYQHVVLLGMGGSSLAPQVLRQTMGSVPSYPQLTVLDSTVPAAVQAVRQAIELGRTLFIVASKSGSTIEALSFLKYFWSLLQQIKGEGAGEDFIAITDAGSPLHRLAEERQFRRVFLNPPDIGGRYSALSYFGLVPAVLSGVDVARLLQRGQDMALLCQPRASLQDNPGGTLGLTLANMWQQGRDKITFVTSAEIASFGLWVEQLLAESLGKDGKGIVPIAGEPLLGPEVYGDDRFFVYMHLQDDHSHDAAVQALEQAGQVVLRLELTDVYDLGAEFFRWEFATAMAGALMGVQPFDQPNVKESKDNTARVLREFEQSGKKPDLTPLGSLPELLATAQHGDYLALMAYVHETAQTDAILSELRYKILTKYHLPTTLGYGPRFLHSTGQLHKGGPNKGLFVQITADPVQDVPIPGEHYSFGTLVASQAVGDLQSLQAHGRRVMRAHLGTDVTGGLQALAAAL